MATERDNDEVYMASAKSSTKRPDGETTTRASASPKHVVDQRVVAFAEEIGRIAGTFQAKADAWLDRDALRAQVASVRDRAAALLEQLADATTKPVVETPAVAAPRADTKGRSGGVVDAPGKKHRKPAPSGPARNLAKSQAEKMRAAMPMTKTSRRRGRG